MLNVCRSFGALKNVSVVDCYGMTEKQGEHYDLVNESFKRKMIDLTRVYVHGDRVPLGADNMYVCM